MGKDDVFTHLYTLIVNSDNTYEVKIDNEKFESGDLESDWEFLPAKKIPDPEDKKPADWDKPEHIPDPEAKKPDDWDDEMDGEWEPPMIDNPDYKGEWKAKQIPNPQYKGKWVHPEINNPDYKEDKELYKYTDLSYVGLDLWQVKSGTIFDNFLITDDAKHAEEVGNETWGKTKDAEKKMKDKQDEEDRIKREEEEKKAKEAKKDEEKDKEGDKEEDKDDDDEDEKAEDKVSTEEAKDKPKDEL